MVRSKSVRVVLRNQQHSYGEHDESTDIGCAYPCRNFPKHRFTSISSSCMFPPGLCA